MCCRKGGFPRERERDTCRVEWEICTIMPILYLNLPLINITVDSYYSEYILNTNDLKRSRKGVKLSASKAPEGDRFYKYGTIFYKYGNWNQVTGTRMVLS